MSTPGPTPAKKRSGVKTCLFGCLAILVVAGVLAIGGCVGFLIWVGDKGEVSEQTVLLTGGEEIFGSLYLTPDNEALLQLTSDIIERNQQMQDNMGGISRFFPKPDPDKASKKEIEQVLPLRLEGALYPAPGGLQYEHLVRAEISHQYRMYSLIFKGAAFMINTTARNDENIRVESTGGLTTIVTRPTPGKPEHGFAFVGNTLYWASPPARITSASELSLEAPAQFAPPDPRLPYILEDVGGEANPIWGLVTGSSLQNIALGLANEDDPGAQALSKLLLRSKTAAFGASLEAANVAQLRLAGLTREGEPIDDAMRAELSLPIRTTTEAGFELDMSCEARGSDRWSCDGSLQGFRDALFSLMERAEAEMDAQRQRSSQN